MSKVCSFDIFDTCLTRQVAVPSGVFYNVAKRVYSKLNIPINQSTVEDFVSARIQAELTARQESDSEDISLDDIWHKLIKSMDWPTDQSLVRCELEAEEELLVPVSFMYGQVQTARQRGSRIIFTSDMYLPQDFIERQLFKHGFAKTGDGFYVSGTVGKTKASGTLFRHLLAEENVPAVDVCHTGDNLHSDYNNPRLLGIRAELFTKATLTRAEISVMQTGQDSLAGACIAGSMRGFRLGSELHGKEAAHELVSQFVAPFIMGFATWILRRAQENGVRRLYFMSRDGQLLCKVADELSAQFGGIDCKYLYISRQALFLPSANAISPEEMPWMERLYKEPVLNRLLALLELSYNDVESHLRTLTGNERSEYRLKSAKDWKRFWDALNAEPVKSRVMRLILTRRETTLGYFKAEGMFDAVPWAVVDLGWSLKCQQSLWKLLRDAKWQGTIAGYYLQLGRQRVNRHEAGDAQSLFYQSAQDYPYVSTSPCSNVELIEYVIGCADHPSVHHYEMIHDNIAPIFEKATGMPSLEFCRNLHDLVLAFVRQNRKLVEHFSETAVCRNVLQSLVTSFFQFPTKEVAGSLQDFCVLNDQNMLDMLPIIKPMDFGTALGLLLPRRKPFYGSLEQRTCLWPEGSLAATPLRVRRLGKISQYLRSMPRRVCEVLMSHG